MDRFLSWLLGHTWYLAPTWDITWRYPTWRCAHCGHEVLAFSKPPERLPR